MKTRFLILNCILTTISFLKVQAQCNTSRLTGNAYFNGSCGELRFQSYVATIADVFGECNGLVFDSPLLGGEISTNTKEEFFNDLHFYPNPTLDVLFIGNVRGTKYRMQIVNSYGSRVYDGDIIDEIDLRHLTAGMYFIHVHAPNSKKFQSHKIIKL